MTAMTGVLSSGERKPSEYDAMLYAGLLPMLAMGKILMSLVSRSPKAATSKQASCMPSSPATVADSKRSQIPADDPPQTAHA